MSLNNIIDDILLTVRNNNIGESEHLSRIQIEQWIHTYRAYLIKQELDKKDITELDPEFIQTIEDVHLDEVYNIYGNQEFVSDMELPGLINFKNKPGVVCVRDKVGNIIQIGNRTKAKFQKNRRYSCGDYIAYVRNNRVYIDGANDLLEYIDIDIIAEDPTKMDNCYDPNSEYPVPDRMIPTIKDMIFTKELNIMLSMPSDNTNDSRDDNQNLR